MALVPTADRQVFEHVHGTAFAKKNLSVHEALESSGLLGWDVRGEALFLSDGMKIETHKAIIGDVAGRATNLGVVGAKYTIVDTERSYEWVSRLLDTAKGELVVDSAGWHKGGSQTFLSLRMPETIKIAGIDEVEMRLTIINSFDGSTPIIAMASATRIFCTNQINSLVRNRKATQIRFRHRGDNPLERRSITEVRDAMGIVFSSAGELQRIAEVWAQTPVTEADVDEVIARLFPIAEDASARVTSRVENRREDAYEAYTSEANLPLVGNAYGLFNGLVEFKDWGGNPDRDYTKRASSQFSHASDVWKTKARDVIAEVVDPALALA